MRNVDWVIVRKENNTANTYGKNKWAILFTVLVMTFMACFDSTVINVALPVMQKSLQVDLNQIQLVASVYLSAICSVLLICGRLGDMFGKTYLSQFGVFTFVVGSALCGVSYTLAQLLAARCVQAVGAAAAMANNMGIITESFPEDERGRALGLYASFVALGMMCGPVVGGLIVSYLPWEYIFWINVPIGGLAFLVGLKTLPYVRPNQREPFDFVGALLLIPAVVCMMSSITTAAEQGVSKALVAELSIAVVCFILLFVAEKHHKYPLVDMRVFSDNIFVINSIVACISFFAIGATEILLPFYFQDACGFSPSIAGFLFAVIPLVNAFVGPVSGAVSDRIGAHIPTMTGLFIYAAGIFLVGCLTQNTHVVVIVLALAFMSFGTSMFQPANNSLFMSSAPADSLGFTGSFVMFVQNIGMALGISGAMAILYGQMSIAAGERVTGYVVGHPEIFFFGYKHAMFFIALVTFIGFIFTYVRYKKSR